MANDWLVSLVLGIPGDLIRVIRKWRRVEFFARELAKRRWRRDLWRIVLDPRESKAAKDFAVTMLTRWP